MTILAWHNDPALKADAVERMRRHKAADDFMRGEYVYAGVTPNEFRGCFHGCLTAERFAAERSLTLRQVDDMVLHGSFWHAQGERMWGIPAKLGFLLDNIFEGFDGDTAAGEWSVAITEAIPCGADLSGVVAAFHAAESADDYDYDRGSLMLGLLAAAPAVTPDA